MNQRRPCSLAASIIAVLVTLCGSAGAEQIVLVAGGGTGNGRPATEAELQAPFGVVFDRSGAMYLVELTGQRVRKVSPDGVITTIAGTGRKGNGGDGGPAIEAEFNGPHSLAIAPNGDLYVADTWNNCVRRIEASTGRISRFAGTGEKGFSGDGGPAEKAQFGGIYCVAFDPGCTTLYLADLDNRRIRTIDMESRVVRTVAGNGERGVPDEGADAAAAPLVDPRAVAVDDSGNVYVLERGGHALRVVDSRGKIRTVAGTGRKGSGGDGGDALVAQLNGPKHLCIDLQNSVIIADAENHLIRKYVPREGRIVRLAGTGAKGTAGLGGSPLEAELAQPHGVYVHPSGTLYIADSSNDRVLKIVP